MPEDTQALAVRTNNSVSFDTVDSRSELKATAELFAHHADIIPQSYRGKVGNCMIALDMAFRMKTNPLAVMQSLYIVNGNPSWKAEFLIAAFNSCGRFSPIRYQFEGEKGKPEWGCRAITADLKTSEVIEGPLITMQMAKDEKWIDKTGSKWKTMPELMIRYRAATFLVRTTAPELSMGLPTVDEAADIGPAAQTRRPLSEVLRGAPIQHATVIATEETSPLSPDELRAQVIDELLDRATGHGVSMANLEAAVGRARSDWTDQDLSDLNETLLKVESGLQTAKEVFA